MRIVHTRNRKVSYLLALALLGFGTQAASDEYVFDATDPVWQSECGSCHIPYPPALLPAASWRILMAQLDRHFGSDASVDPATATAITSFLDRNAGRPRRENAGSGTPPVRITETRWFRNEHDEVPARTWRSPAVKSAANCEACHAQAAGGNFSERTQRVPR